MRPSLIRASLAVLVLCGFSSSFAASHEADALKDCNKQCQEKRKAAQAQEVALITSYNEIPVSDNIWKEKGATGAEGLDSIASEENEMNNNKS